jgi:hypothetical protein
MVTYKDKQHSRTEMMKRQFELTTKNEALDIKFVNYTIDTAN